MASQKSIGNAYLSSPSRIRITPHRHCWPRARRSNVEVCFGEQMIDFFASIQFASVLLDSLRSPFSQIQESQLNVATRCATMLFHAMSGCPMSNDNDKDDELPSLRRMLTEQMVLEEIPISRTTLYRLERAGKFPRSVYVSPNRRLWFRDEVAAWQRAINDNHERNPKRGRGKGRRRRSGG